MRMHVFPQVADSLSQLCFDQTIMLRCLHAANFSERSVGGAHGEACFQSEDHLSCRSDGGVRRVVFRVRRVDLYSQQRQTEQAMLEEARTFAREMDAVWQFMDNSQSIINNSSSGGYEFKGLHCSVVGKSVGRLFSAGSDYHIRYTNFDPRSEQDIPDEFETKALEAFTPIVR